LAAKTAELVEDLLEEAMQFGPSVVKRIGYTLDLPGVVFCDDLLWLAGRNPRRRFLCASYGDCGSAVGWPLTHENGTSVLLRHSQLPEAELTAISKAQDDIARLVRLVKTTWWFGYANLGQP
jgi:hypothetical protein